MKVGLFMNSDNLYESILVEQVVSTVREGVEVFGKNGFKVLIIDSVRSVASHVIVDGSNSSRNDIALALETPYMPVPFRKELHYRAVELTLPLLFAYMVDCLGISKFSNSYEFTFHMIDALDDVLEKLND